MASYSLQTEYSLKCALSLLSLMAADYSYLLAIFIYVYVHYLPGHSLLICYPLFVNVNWPAQPIEAQLPF